MFPTFKGYPVWLFYWWWDNGRTRPNMDKFRKTIVSDEFTAKMNGRGVSSEPMQEVGRIIDYYRTQRVM